MTYEEIELFLVDLFKFEFFDVAVLPDTEREMESDLTRPKVWICYDGSDYNNSEALDFVSQKDNIKIGFEIRAKKRRGETGVLAIFETIKAKILGLKIIGLERFQLQVFTPISNPNNPRPNYFHYWMSFQTFGYVVENQPEEEAPLLKKYVFLENEV